MKIQQFLEHHGVALNPFSEEDAQTDPVFKEHCIQDTFHPAWDKVYGDPNEPSTAIVFGEKGAGKTALRLQVVRRLADHNRRRPEKRVFVIEYDDFNPFLDRFRDRLAHRHREPRQALAQWKLWDHMDAILSLGVTQLVDRILHGGREDSGRPNDVGPLELGRLDRHQKRDLLLLAACYDQCLAETYLGRWRRLRRKLHFWTWKTRWHFVLGLVGTLAVAGVVAGTQNWHWLKTVWPYLIVAAAWVPWAARWLKWSWRAMGIERQLRVVSRQSGPLRKILLRFTPDEMAGQPLPDKERTDDRYELLAKLQGILATLGFAGIVVLVDRVDEPHLVNGSPEQMRALLWPLLDNKFLKHPGLGFKLLLPIELSYYVDREDREFYQRARLDKQNVVPSLEWSGESLYDVANARLKACAANGQAPSLRALFDDSVTDQRLIDALRALRVPRHLFKFLYRALVAHCNSHTDEKPSWKIAPETFESTLALYHRDQDAFDRGMGRG